MTEADHKTQILERLQAERGRLERSLDFLSQEGMLEPNVIGEWSVKDVLAHLADWETHMCIWLTAARHGDPVKSPDFGLTWEQLDLFNQHVFEAHRGQSLEEVQAYFRNTHSQFMDMVEAMPDEEMLTPGRYAFLGTDTIYNWLVQYADHDQWAADHILEWMKARDLPESEQGRQ
jgi:hypothetical protein